MPILIVTSVDAEARAIAGCVPIERVRIVTSGVGRTNAAAATTEAILRGQGRIDAIISAGVAGALPGSNLHIGDCIVASRCIYMEEGLISPHGFVTMASLGFPLGDFEGNAVPVDDEILDQLSDAFPIGPIATVATCSGTDEAAETVVKRTGAVAEAMEGAAVVHVGRRFRLPAIEFRAISNTTGNRAAQQWDIAKGLEALGIGMGKLVQLLDPKR